MKERKRSTGSFTEEEQTMRPGTLRPPSSGPSDVESTVKPHECVPSHNLCNCLSLLSLSLSLSPPRVRAAMSTQDAKVLETLSGHLRQFCITAEKLQ